MLADIRYALRLLGRSPGFTLVAVLTLALGIGANTAIFSVVDAVLLQPLPYPDASRLMVVWEEASFVGFPRNTPAPANWVDWRKRSKTFEDIAASRGGSYNLTGDGPPEVLPGRRVTANFWPVIGTKPVIGRVFTQAEEDGDAAVAVISNALWQRRFGGDPKIAGRRVLLSGRSFEVIGVMPPGFTYPSRIFDVWTPAQFTPRDLANRGSHYLQCIGRLKPGVTAGEAQREMSVIAAQLAKEYPDTNARVGVVVVPLREQIAGRLETALFVLMGAASCVLLIGCANLANLLLARAQKRQRELAVRSALGASRGRIVTQLATEAMVLAGLGAAAGIALAGLVMTALEKLIPQGMSDVALTVDTRLVLFTGAVALVTGLLFGVAPALRMSAVSLADAIRQGDRGSAGARQQWMRDALVAGEVALALTLLTGAGLLIRTLSNLRSVDAGMKTDHLLTVLTPLARDPYSDFGKRNAFVTGVLERVRAVPGVVSAAYTSSLPYTAIGNTSGYQIQGIPLQPNDPGDALVRTVSTEFLQTIGARLAEGRFFGPEDRTGGDEVIIINETFAKMYWPGKSALGAKITCPGGRDQKPRTVIGVVKDVRERGAEVALKPGVYFPQPQAGNVWAWPETLVVRTLTDPASIGGAVRDAVWAVSPTQPMRDMRTMEEVTDRELEGRAQQMWVLQAFAGLALVLAAVGIYGVLSYAVAQRTREIGVRMALGASPREVAAMVLKRGALMTGAGIVLGAAGAIGVSRALKTLVVGVEPGDPWTFAAVAALLAVVAMAACWAPTWRASRVDPMVALRDE